ncbi:hypothetical protein EXW28_10735 [Bacillus mycoides]|nr:hypothetical protein EXW28_10735 [Bacillus mycoides]
MSNYIGVKAAFFKITYAMRKNKISCPCGQLIYIIIVIGSYSFILILANCCFKSQCFGFSIVSSQGDPS